SSQSRRSAPCSSPVTCEWMPEPAPPVAEPAPARPDSSRVPTRDGGSESRRNVLPHKGALPRCKKPRLANRDGVRGGPGRARTDAIPGVNVALYQLSYRPSTTSLVRENPLRERALES